MDKSKLIGKWVTNRRTGQRGKITSIDDKLLHVDVDGTTVNYFYQMYSAGLNHYLKFVKGDEFEIAPNEIKLMDVAVPVKKKQGSSRQSWERSDIVKTQALESADYKCEIDQGHMTFTSSKTGCQYMEGHHALPLKFQDKFSNSLDIYANIVCLCPICHRLLHYGVPSEKKESVDKIYYDRSERLASSGIRISKEEFESLAI